jgi:SAM-dependent methyltransferase
VKTRESGMPDEDLWESFFTPEDTLRRLRLTPRCRDVVDFGCGYGTFAIPAARIVAGTVHALDIEPDMVAATRAKAEAEGLKNLAAIVRDFITEGSGLQPRSVEYAMLFNILHAERPDVLLAEAFRVLAPGGVLGVMHWNWDPTTPRGPSMEIRPRPEQCLQWAGRAGFQPLDPLVVPLPPHHYGFACRRPPE